ncbi:cellulase family glycosylhydrolase [Flavihumibacter petaseus]|uniref:Glycoside hydrolase family 5 domain-containing protein n=1 Tax=Flavihumibacter petaseus NBRC 106054 TaxID=1220578 RepID=A0A0E9MVF2_9BACT|nr:cellulase family glycosylhydrolase [Flavihumibacter petaseus]GAO41559.1 hypothetical protein FPE01S_01_05730 [Flavihumibacter petaseus NBRC 106054]
MKKSDLTIVLLLTLAALLGPLQKVDAQSGSQLRWSPEKAWQWYKDQQWICGANYIPAYAINYTAMWDRTTFDSVAIDRELALAEQTGLNSLRVVLQYAVYAEDPEGFLRRMNTFLCSCEKHRIKMVPALFDDCVFGLEHDPKTGRQPEPLEGWYAWAWSPSPGHSMVVDSSTFPLLERYVKGVITRFSNDKRILFWDLYNEPTNGGLGTASLPLLRNTIRWAREVRPSQPLSVGVWDGNKRLNEIALNGSDIVSFHNYGNLDALRKMVEELKLQGRPLVCTEWMNRPAGSLISTHIGYFSQEKIGCMLWGVVNGKTQTHLPWGHRPGDPAPKIWQHDLYTADFRPYDTAEISLLKQYCNTVNRK